jgi:type IV pilus assembly protein PilY1
MRSQRSRLLTISISALLASSICLTAFADDSEIFGSAATTPLPPNILFILDTSGSMDSHVYKRADFNPSNPYNSTYTHACDDSLIYYETGTNIPTCGSPAVTRGRVTIPEIPASPSFAKTALKCMAANNSLWGTSTINAKGIYGGTGVGDNAIRWVTTTVAASTTSTPTTSARTRTITSRHDHTVVTTQLYTAKYTVNSRGRASWVSETPSVVPAVTLSTNDSATTATTSAWGTATVTPSGTGTTSSTTTVSSAWQTSLAAPTTNTTTSVSTGSPGTPTTTNAPGSWIDNTSTVTYTPNPYVPNPMPTVQGTYNYPFTRTTTTVTPRKKVDTETESTPVTSSSTTTTTIYAAGDIECDGDKTTGTDSLGYPNNVAPTSAQWTSTKANSYWDTGGGLQQYTFYSGRYLNYLATAPTTDEGTRLKVMQSAISDLLDSMTGKNVGLMRYSSNDNACTSRTDCNLQAQGGMVTYAMSPVDTNRDAMKRVVNGYRAEGWTPLSETLFEAYRYYSGGNVLFGNTSQVYDPNIGAYVSSKSVDASRTTVAGPQYKTPITGSCQNNYIIYLTDGLPTQDTQANSLIRSLSDFADPIIGGGACESNTADGGCLSALAQYMNKHDLNSNLPNAQTVQSYFIGFGSDFSGAGGADAFAYLESAATRGGGFAYSASDKAELTQTLKNALGNIQLDTSFAAPSVAINAFNRTQTLNDLFISVFKPTDRVHWQGNVKKYHVSNNNIVDQSGDVALNTATGFFDKTAKSFWTYGDPDGANTVLAAGNGDGSTVSAGGAAHRLPAPSARNVYTYISTITKPTSPVDLTTASNAVKVGNTNLTAGKLGDATMTSAQRDSLINWARGQDTDDKDNPNSVTTDTRSVMGDPVHARPAVVIYGGTAADPDTVVFAPTNDGYLHAIGGKDGDGAELWSFIPQELLPGLKALHDDAQTSAKHYALDGDIVVAKYDVNGDGIVSAADNDRVVLYFSQGRGGSYYYALDVTDKNTPKFLWSLGSSDLPGVGQSWSAPALTRVNISGATQNSQKFVLIFGGGYDVSEESAGYRTSNAVGKRIYMIDALYGTLLWSASDSGADLNISRMDHAIPSNVTVLDLDDNGYADRMYVGDMAGQIFRFDITNGQTRANLVAGGVIASLGTRDDTAHTDANNRRFYNAPDVSLVTPIGTPAYFSVSIGSGYRGHPLNTAIQDRFYSIRDRKPFTKMTQAEYNTVMTSSVVHDSNLTDITTVGTTVPIASPGWKLLLNDPSWQGEKVLSTSVTFDNKVLFTTYIPSAGSVLSADGCSTTSTGKNRSYAISVFDGGPVKQQGSNFDPSHLCTAVSCAKQDRYDLLAQGGIASGIVVLFPGHGSAGSSSSSSSGTSSSSSSSSSSAPPAPNDTMCLAGTELVRCPPGKGVYKTSWRELTAP